MIPVGCWDEGARLLLVDGVMTERTFWPVPPVRESVVTAGLGDVTATEVMAAGSGREPRGAMSPVEAKQKDAGSHKAA